VFDKGWGDYRFYGIVGDDVIWGLVKLGIKLWGIRVYGMER